MAKIEFNHVGKRFPDGTVTLKAANFTIRDGEFFILVGPSGCGKSTLLNMIVGLEEVSEGEIRVDGRVVNDLDPKNRNMAMVFQSYAIYPHMSVRDNIAFPLRLAKLPNTEIDRRVDEAAAILELTPLLDRKPATLSGGQRQRVAMGRALVREPQVFLLDEPLSNLDARLRVQMRNEIARLQKRLGTTMVYVTHDQTEAMTLGDRVAVMNRGELQQIGIPQALYHHPANLFVAGFIGSPAMNLLPAAIAGPKLHLPIGAVDWPETIKDGAYGVAGIRPEHFRLAASVSAMPDTIIWNTSVERLEWLGAELYVYCEIRLPEEWRNHPWPEALRERIGSDGALSLIARLDPSLPIRQGEKLALQCDRRNIQLFSIETTKNLGLSDEAQARR
ncbi:sn-glycerol-3-phosphate ABC transporter ATP-binding protein UgpC [Methylobacter sp.]|jgi:multiple sugar transport system ATP-binding protein|uniref:ABC transporter ATP-binding protein n=1 Tax=Methylobacter sp. TaxID=2051955 RepID=UPI0012091E0A|nr:sn-glycerol-3-phosphate ABC transporter ATP-binding protein UgpC [Methylobacter sp.]TAK63356.1 MAG: sn-glycerol-3-phosphate ABC transporter ATP-binding protein UgpC [Methylobacter sp.]